MLNTTGLLAVSGSAQTAPQRAVVAIDFSDISVRAAQAGIDALADDAQVDLVHVIPDVMEDAFAVPQKKPYRRWVLAQFAALDERLATPAGVRVKHVLLRGRPAVEVLGHAERVGAGLISTGTHGRGFIERTMLGSVTTKLLRRASCMVLTAPRDPLPAPPGSEQTPRSADAPLSWSVLLKDFTRRNSGRRTVLEVDDLELGAQAQEYNYPLLGASFSERDGRMDLMLGDAPAGVRHLALSMGGVRALDVLTDGAGKDVALRVQHGASQTLLTFVA